MGCTFPISRATLSTACDSLKKGSLALLMGSTPLADLTRLRVGAFGNADSTDETTEWVPVLVENLPKALASGQDEEEAEEGGQRPGVCPNMILSRHTEVIYARVGSAANPQAKVVGVKVSFGQPTDVRVRCTFSSACDVEGGGGEQLVELSSSVSFVDVTKPAMEQLAEFPVIEAKFPYDFFYPFVDDYEVNLRSGSGCLVANALVLALTCAIFTLLCSSAQ